MVQISQNKLAGGNSNILLMFIPTWGSDPI